MITKSDSNGPFIGVKIGFGLDVIVGVGVDVIVGVGLGVGAKFSKSYAPLTFNIPPVTHLPTRLLLAVVLFMMAVLICSIDFVGIILFNNATAPASCGAAILVPVLLP